MSQKKKIAIPAKRPYQKDEFVGRRAELAKVTSRVSQGKRGQDIDLPVLNFWGVQGCGKSWLMRHIARRYRGPGRLSSGEKKRTFTMLFDFAGFDSFEWKGADLAVLIRPLIEDVLAQVRGIEQDEAKDLLETVDAVNEGHETIEELAEAFVNWIDTLTDEFVPIVLLDTIEQITPQALAKVEEHMLEPLISTDQVIVITAGRREVARWRRFAVRRRQADPIKLEAFTPKDTARQVKKQGFDLPGELVYPYSFGLAYASQVIALAISELSNGRGVNAHVLRENERRLGQWLAALDDHLLQHIPQHLRPTIHKICGLRVINEGVLDHLLADDDRSQDCRQLLDELELTRVVWWDADQGAYMMAPSLRRLLSLRLRLQEPEAFARRHARAADYYCRMIEERPYDCGPLLVEALYHMAYGRPDWFPAEVNDFLDQVLKVENFTVGGVDVLIDRLRSDEELREALPDGTIDEILKLVQNLSRQVRRTRLSVK